MALFHPFPLPRPTLRVAACASLALAAALAARGQAPTSVQLSAGIHLITAEVAGDDRSRMQGLMFRRALAPNHGMLFVFDQKAQHCMWMRNTLLPLSVAFLDDDGSIVNIEDMQPQTDDSHCARRPVRYALEMGKDWFAQHGIRAGQALRGIPGP